MQKQRVFLKLRSKKAKKPLVRCLKITMKSFVTSLGIVYLMLTCICSD